MKPIMLTPEAKANALELFKKLLEDAAGNSDLKINITAETLILEQGIQKPTVYILANAYIKMLSLINNSDKELAWYGIATRVNHNYLIEDILVYPQTVTSTTVDADEEKCAKWFMELPDNVINNLRFQGHSHVNMGTTPSGRDTDNWLKFANLLKPNEFMILCIGNKKGEFHWNIYDKAVNVYFENKDISTVVVDDKGNSIVDWAKASIDKYIVTEKPTTWNPGTNGVIKLNEHCYQTIHTTTSADVCKEMLSYIPSELKDIIEYEPESDTYFTGTPGIPNFRFSPIYDCHTCSGEYFRTLYPKTKLKKENKKQVKKGIKV